MATLRYLDQRLKLNMLRVVDAIDRHGSLLKASGALGLTQPALTKCVRELEDILQMQVFERHAKGVTVTEAGKLMVDTARKVMAELGRLDDELDVLSVPGGGATNVGALPTAAAGVLPGVLVRLKRVNPALKVKVQQGRTEDLIPLLLSGDIDLIVGRFYPPTIPDDLIREPLWSEQISLLARRDHPIFEIANPSLDDIRQYDLVLPTITQRVGQEIEHMLTLLDLTPATSMRSNSYGFIREILCGSDTLSVMPRLLMAGDLQRKTLRVVPSPTPVPERSAGLILRRGHSLPMAGLSFVECLRRYAAEIVAEGIATAVTAEI